MLVGEGGVFSMQNAQNRVGASEFGAGSWGLQRGCPLSYRELRCSYRELRVQGKEIGGLEMLRKLQWESLVIRA